MRSASPKSRATLIPCAPASRFDPFGHAARFGVEASAVPAEVAEDATGLAASLTEGTIVLGAASRETTMEAADASGAAPCCSRLPLTHPQHPLSRVRTTSARVP